MKRRKLGFSLFPLCWYVGGFAPCPPHEPTGAGYSKISFQKSTLVKIGNLGKHVLGKDFLPPKAENISKDPVIPSDLKKRHQAG